MIKKYILINDNLNKVKLNNFVKDEILISSVIPLVCENIMINFNKKGE